MVVALLAVVVALLLCLLWPVPLLVLGEFLFLPFSAPLGKVLEDAWGVQRELRSSSGGLLEVS